MIRAALKTAVRYLGERMNEMAGKYAATTDVPVERSQQEIKATLKRFGATGYAYLEQDATVAVAFEVANLRVLMRMELPDPRDPGWQVAAREAAREKRRSTQLDAIYEQTCRQRWRSLANSIKAKLAAIDDQISTVEQEFLAFVALPGDSGTVGDRIIPEMREALAHGDLPSLIPGIRPSRIIELPSGTDR